MQPSIRCMTHTATPGVPSLLTGLHTTKSEPLACDNGWAPRGGWAGSLCELLNRSGAQKQESGTPAAWAGAGGSRLSGGAWETVGQPGHRQGREVRAGRGFVPHTIADALLDKGTNKRVFGSCHTAQHPGGPRKPSLWAAHPGILLGVGVGARWWPAGPQPPTAWETVLGAQKVSEEPPRQGQGGGGQTVMAKRCFPPP